MVPKQSVDQCSLFGHQDCRNLHNVWTWTPARTKLIMEHEILSSRYFCSSNVHYRNLYELLVRLVAFVPRTFTFKNSHARLHSKSSKARCSLIGRLWSLLHGFWFCKTLKTFWDFLAFHIHRLFLCKSISTSHKKSKEVWLWVSIHFVTKNGYSHSYRHHSIMNKWSSL